MGCFPPTWNGVALKLVTTISGSDSAAGMQAVFVGARAVFACSCAGIVFIAAGCSGGRSEEGALKEQFPELASVVNDSDRAEASTEIGRTDRNADGVVTEAEWIDSKYQPAERFKL